MKLKVHTLLCIVIVFSLMSMFTSKANALTTNDVDVEVIYPDGKKPDKPEESHELFETYIIDRDFDPNNQNYYRVYGEETADWENDAEVDATARITMTFSGPTNISLLRMKFTISVAENSSDVCYGYKVIGYIGSEEKYSYTDICEENEEIKYTFQIGEGDGYWNSTINSNVAIDRLVVEIEGYAVDAFGWANSTFVEIKIYEIWPSEATDPIIEFEKETGTERDRVNITVHDSGSGLSELSVNCSTRNVSTEKGSELTLDFRIPAFIPGTIDPVEIPWTRKNATTGMIYWCGAYARDRDQNETWCIYRRQDTTCQGTNQSISSFSYPEQPLISVTQSYANQPFH